MKFSAILLACVAANSAQAFAPSSRFAATRSALNLSVGDSLPSATLFSDFPDVKKIDSAEYAKGKKLIIVGLPGAFTPTWSSVQVPGYLEAEDDLKEAGIDEVLVYCVNDSAVMAAWSDDQDADDTDFVNLIGDPTGDFTEATDMQMTHPGPVSVGIIGRCKRHAIYVEDGTVKYIAVSEGEDDPAGDDDPSATLAPAMLKAIKDL